MGLDEILPEKYKGTPPSDNIDIVAATDLSSEGTANSYVVSKGGIYSISAVKGNSDISVGSVASVEVLWESFGTDVQPAKGDLVEAVIFQKGKIYFKTSSVYREGNAVIAAKNASGTILWSWHIWLTDQPQEHVYNNNAGTMMDRNLGATSATPGDVGALGLFYQWGRKDPFLGSSSIIQSTIAKSTIVWPSSVSVSPSVGTIEYTTSHPTTYISGGQLLYEQPEEFLWSPDKTIYDPCPYGWRVPDGGDDGVWVRADIQNNYSANKEGLSFITSTPSTTWYPACGYMDSRVGELMWTGTFSYYWSSASDGKNAYSLHLASSDGANPLYSVCHGSGFSVRCFKEGSSEIESETPEQPTKSDWHIVGSFTGEGWGWDAAAGIALDVLDANYFGLLGFELPADAQFRFIQGTAWGGAEVGAVASVVEPNTIQAKGTNNIMGIPAGKYDIYLAADASAFYIMSEGKTPAEATDPAPVGVTYTVVGTLNNINWNNAAPEGLMAQEGDYYVAKNVPFVTAATLYGGADQFEFKIVETGTWNGYGVNEAAVYEANTEIPVAYGAGNNVNIAAPEGTYDVYFDKTNEKVWVVPVGQSETPEKPTKSDWHIVGSFTGEDWGWDAAAGIALDVLDANYFGLLGFELPEGAQFKFLQGTAWGGAEVGAVASVVEPNTIQAKGTNNIMGIPAGKYDIYLAADASAFYIMSEGKTPAEATEPAPVEVTYTVTGTIKDANWNNAAPAGLMAFEGGVYVAKNVEFQWESTCYGGADQIALRIFETGTWTGYGVEDGSVVYEAGAEVPVAFNAQGNIAVATPEGTYDVYFDKTNEKVWVVPVGQSETPETPAQVVYEDDFSWFGDIALTEGAGDAVGTDDPSSIAPNVFTMYSSEAFLSAFAERGYKFYWGTVGSTEFTEGPDPDQKDSRAMYLQSNYLKFGKTSWNGAISLPALSSIEGAADVVIEFDWCWQVTGAYKPDLMTLSVDATAGTFAATGAATSAELESAQSTVDGESHIEWQHVVVELNGATAETILTIRPTNADPDIQNAARHQNRWYLDNIKISTK